MFSEFCGDPYDGSKFRLVSWIIGGFPPHRCYVEAFGGSAAVLLRKPPSFVEVYNDLDGAVVNFDPVSRAALVEACALTPLRASRIRGGRGTGRRPG